MVHTGGDAGAEGNAAPAAGPDHSTDAPAAFISYASQDAEVAGALVEALERHAIRCWIAPRDVKVGAHYADAIVRAISGTHAFVLVLSGASIASSHVSREIERASSKGRPIFALRIDAAPLAPALEYFLSESQWVDARSGTMAAAHAKLIDALREPVRLPPGAGRTANPVPTGGRVARRFRLSRRSAVLLAAGVAAIAAIATFSIPRFRPAVSATAERGQPVAPTRALGERSIAVMPFADLTEKHDQEFFAEGVAEAVRDRLAKVPGLKVVGRTSSFQFKERNADTAAIAATLGVGYLLEGSVRKDAGHVRVSAQLIDASAGQQRWNDHFDFDVVDVLNVQDTIAAELARTLQLTVEVDATAKSAVKSPAALDAYFRGRQSLNRYSRADCEAAAAYFKTALSLDPTFAPAAAGLAQTYVFIGEEGWLPTALAFGRAREAAQLAQRLDPHAAAPHLSLATIHVIFDWDLAGANAELKQAIAGSQHDSTAAQVAALIAEARGDWDEALQHATEAIALDPLDARTYWYLGYNIYLHVGRYGDAEQTFRRMLQISPAFGAGHYALGVALLLQGKPEPALTEFLAELPEDGRFEGSAAVYCATGRKAQSAAALDAAVRQNAKSWPSAIARAYATCGEANRAFDWLERAYAEHDEELFGIKGDPLLSSLAGDQRYHALLRKMGLPE